MRRFRAVIEYQPSLLVLASLILLAVSCGFKDPEYIKYDDGTDTTSTTATTTTTGTTTTTTSSCKDVALAAFGTSVATAVNSTCSNCHMTSSVLKLTTGNNSENRDKLYAYTGTDASKLFGYISGATHPGGNQSKVLPLASIESWITAEKSCL